MAVICSLKEAVAEHLRDGHSLALEGFTHLIPHAAGHEVIRQGRRDLTLMRMTPDLIYDQLIGMGCARKLIFAWGGNPGVGSLYRLREAVEKGWPQPLELEEHSHAGMANAYVAGASNLPFAVMRGYKATDLKKYNGNIRSVTCPFTGEDLAAVPALRPDVSVIHAQCADAKGNVLIHGIVGLQKEVALAGRHTIVTVEEIAEKLEPKANSVVLPHWALDAVCAEPGGAHPSYAMGYYERDNPFYKAWDDISKDREAFARWMERHVLGTEDFAGFRASIDAAAAAGEEAGA